MNKKNCIDVRPGRSVRELGGEVWAEISNRFSDEELNWQLKSDLADVIMGVLARHIGEEIRDDPDLLVTPLL